MSPSMRGIASGASCSCHSMIARSQLPRACERRSASSPERPAENPGDIAGVRQFRVGLGGAAAQLGRFLCGEVVAVAEAVHQRGERLLDRAGRIGGSARAKATKLSRTVIGVIYTPERGDWEGALASHRSEAPRGAAWRLQTAFLHPCPHGMVALMTEFVHTGRLRSPARHAAGRIAWRCLDGAAASRRGARKVTDRAQGDSSPLDTVNSVNRVTLRGLQPTS